MTRVHQDRSPSIDATHDTTSVTASDLNEQHTANIEATSTRTGAQSGRHDATSPAWDGAHVWTLLEEYTKELQAALEIRDIPQSMMSRWVKRACEKAGVPQAAIRSLSHESGTEDDDSEGLQDDSGCHFEENEEGHTDASESDEDDDVQSLREKISEAQKEYEQKRAEYEQRLMTLQASKEDNAAAIRQARLHLRELRRADNAQEEDLNALQAEVDSAANIMRDKEADLAVSLKAKRVRKTQLQIERRKKQRQLSGSVTKSFKMKDLQWAYNCLHHLLRIAPTDPMAILRYITRTQADTESYLPLSLFGALEEELVELNTAISRAQSVDTGQEVRHLIHCMQVAILYRQAARLTSIGNYTGEVAASRLLRIRNARYVKDIGIRAWMLAWTISPRNMFGILIMPYLGLTSTALHDAKQAELIALMAMLSTSENDGTKDRTGLPSCYATEIDFVVERFLPAMELAFIKILRCDAPLAESLKHLIVLQCEEHQQDVSPFSFGLSASDASPALFMPNPSLLDGSYKTLDLEVEPPQVIKYYKGLIRVNLKKHLQLQRKHGIIGDEICRQILAHYRIWYTPPNAPRYTQDHLGSTRPPAAVDEDLWSSLDTRLAYWSLFTSTPNCTRQDPSFFGDLSDESLDASQQEDSNLECPGQVADG